MEKVRLCYMCDFVKSEKDFGDPVELLSAYNGEGRKGDIVDVCKDCHLTLDNGHGRCIR